jgi:hypothetical protein
MERYEFLRLSAALATAPHRFCVSFDEGDPDDPFSIVLTYDGSLPQPWGRTDVPRLIRSIAIDPADPGTFVVMSDEGDVYFLRPDRTVHEKIPGSGLYSPDSTGLGAMNVLILFRSKLVAFGLGSQAYIRLAGGWTWLNPSGVGSGDDTLGFNTVAAAGYDGDKLICAGVSMARQERMSADFGRLLAEAGQRGDLAEVNRLMNLRRSQDRKDEPQVHVFLDDRWRQIALPRSVVLKSVFVERADIVWLVGLQGAIFKGNPEDGFQEVGFRGDTDDLYSITKFRQDMILASGYRLRRFDGHVLWPLRPRLDPAINNSVPTPLKLQTVGDVMFYFDYKHGVCRWDGKTWDWIDFPPGLLDREFKGIAAP